MLGSLPEYFVSYEPLRKAVYINMFADFAAALGPLGIDGAASLRMHTRWPYAEPVSITFTLPKTTDFTVMLRIPSWISQSHVLPIYVSTGDQNRVSKSS